MKLTTGMETIRIRCHYLHCVVCKLLNYQTMDDRSKLKLVSFNCKGFKSWQGYIQELIQKNDVTFLCEHWLQQNEIVLVQESLSEENYWSILKSSVDQESPLIGRSHGGTGFVCHKNIECDSDRVCMIQIFDNMEVK